MDKRKIHPNNPTIPIKLSKEYDKISRQSGQSNQLRLNSADSKLSQRAEAPMNNPPQQQNHDNNVQEQNINNYQLNNNIQNNLYQNQNPRKNENQFNSINQKWRKLDYLFLICSITSLLICSFNIFSIMYSTKNNLDKQNVTIDRLLEEQNSFICNFKLPDSDLETGMKFSQVASRIIDLEKSRDSINIDITNIKVGLNIQVTQINQKISSDFTIQKEKFDILTQKLQQLNDQEIQIKSAIKSIQDSLSEMNTQINSNSNQLDQKEQKITSLGNKITLLESQQPRKILIYGPYYTSTDQSNTLYDTNKYWTIHKTTLDSETFKIDKSGWFEIIINYSFQINYCTMELSFFYQKDNNQSQQVAPVDPIGWYTPNAGIRLFILIQHLYVQPGEFRFNFQKKLWPCGGNSTFKITNIMVKFYSDA